MEKPQNPDIIAIDNTLKLLRRGKWELQGEEALAFFRLFEYWARKLNELKKPPITVESVQPIKSPESEKKIKNKKSE